MNIDIGITDEDRARLTILFGNDADLERLIRIIAQAGAAELLAQATGRAVFSTMTDLRLYRVFCLLRAGMTLKEAESLVSFIFKVSLPSARRLVENALTRYEIEERDMVRERIADLLNAANWRESRWEVELPAGFVRDAVLNETARLNSADPQRAGRGALWLFPDETFQATREAFGLKKRQRPTK